VPRKLAISKRDERRPEGQSVEGRGRTVLIVEDDDLLRDVTCRMLERRGYQVLSSSDRYDAARAAAQHVGPIDLLLTDVIMPRTNERDVAERILSMRPDVKVLYLSGYAASVLDSRDQLGPGYKFIEKPFSEPSLLAAVATALSPSSST
jgi:two-component system cell cycle sensor histidine kinase/response regulator CckA